MQQVAGRAVQVEALGRGVRRDEHAHRRVRIVERRLDVLAGRLVQALGSVGAEECKHSLRRVAFPQAPGEVAQRGLVLGEDDQALVVAELVSGPEQALDQRGEGVKAGIDDGRLIRSRRFFERETEGVECTFDAADLVIHIVDKVPEPRAHDGCGGGPSLLGFPVVAGLLAYRTRGRRARSVSAAASTSGSENPCIARRQDSANAVGQDSNRFPRISTAKVPARRRGLVPADTSFLTAVRKASNAAETAVSRGSVRKGIAVGGWRVQNRGSAPPSCDCPPLARRG